MSFPKVYPIANIDSVKLDYVEKLLSAGAEILQLRAKNFSEEELIRFTYSTLELKNKLHSNCKIIINDSVKVALKCKADGVHLGQEDSSIMDARKSLGKDKIIGLSTHNLEQVSKAPTDLLNYLALGPIFNSKSKSGHAPLVGLETLKLAKQKVRIPLVAIGGIDFTNANDVYNAGADCIAGISIFEEILKNKNLEPTP